MSNNLNIAPILPAAPTITLNQVVASSAPSNVWFNTSYSAPLHSSSTFSLYYNGKELVRLTKDGKVEWIAGFEINEAAEAFAQSMRLGAELAAGISRDVKLKMRDSVFEDLIKIAKEKGSLSADDLTYLLTASKIVEKLQSGN